MRRPTRSEVVEELQEALTLASLNVFQDSAYSASVPPLPRTLPAAPLVRAALDGHLWVAASAANPLRITFLANGATLTALTLTLM